VSVERVRGNARYAHQPAWLALALLVAASCMHAPSTPRIDGAPGAPIGPAATWPTPKVAQTPPPPANPPVAPSATAAFAADSANAGSVTQLALPDVVDLALNNNPATRESWMNARAAADLYGASRGTLYPNVNGSVNLSRSQNTSGSSIGGAISTSPDSTQTNRTSLAGAARTQLTTSASLSYLLLDLGGRRGTIEEAKQRAIAANLAHNATVQDVVLQTESALFSFLATRALRDAQLVAVQEAASDTAAAVERMRVGVATLADVLQTRTALAQARFQLATLEGNLVSARGNLATTMGLPANARFDVPGIAPRDSVAEIAASVDTLINRAIMGRAQIAELLAEAEALAAAVRVARSAGYPALTLSTTTGVTRANPSNFNGRNYLLQLGLQIPVFNGFARLYDARAAQEQYEAGLARVTQTRQQVTVQVFVAYSALQTATQRVHVAAELLASALESADVALGRYREGVGTIVDVLLAQSALTTARASDIQARWEWRTALAQLAHDTGSLDLSGRANIPLGNTQSGLRR